MPNGNMLTEREQPSLILSLEPMHKCSHPLSPKVFLSFNRCLENLVSCKIEIESMSAARLSGVGGVMVYVCAYREESARAKERARKRERRGVITDKSGV